jgi:hypothetical protein
VPSPPIQKRRFDCIAGLVFVIILFGSCVLIQLEKQEPAATHSTPLLAYSHEGRHHVEPPSADIQFHTKNCCN